MITCWYVEYQSKISIIWILKELILQGRKKPQFWHWFSQPAVHHWYHIKNPPQDISEFANYELFYKTVQRMKIPYFSVSYIFLHPKLLWYPFSNSSSDFFSKQKKNISMKRGVTKSLEISILMYWVFQNLLTPNKVKYTYLC